MPLGTDLLAVLQRNRELDRAWFAGIIDAEGSIFLSAGRYACISFAMVCDTPYRAQEMTGAGAVYRERLKSGKVAHRWVASGEAALSVIDALFPYLVTKRSNAERVYRKYGIVPHTPDLTDWSLRTAWAAGVIDGDGTIGMYKAPKARRHHVIISVSMTHFETVHALRNHFEMGSVNPFRRRNPSPKHKAKLVWVAATSDAICVLKEVSPFLVSKRYKALTVLASTHLHGYA